MTLLTDAMFSPVDSILCADSASGIRRGDEIRLRQTLRQHPFRHDETTCRTFCGGAFMFAATISQASTNPEHAKNTALCPSTFSNHPPITPPSASPMDCVVLYTPAAAPFLVPGANFDTS